MNHLFWLTDAQMARLEPFFLKFHGKPRVDALARRIAVILHRIWIDGTVFQSDTAPKVA